jgi:UDP-N-acetylmuramoyl-L-alanyl-D-glutamate--2,6-diaminopimelate ligase
MNLSKLIDTKDPVVIRGSKDKEILGLRTSSKEVRPKDLFISISSQRAHIDEAILSGASAVVVDIYNPFLPKEITQIEHQNPKDYAGVLANRFYQNPTQHLSLFGVTGTSGKSTTTWMIRHLLGEDCCGVLGTLGAWIYDHCIEVHLTTPEPSTICRVLNEMVKGGLKFCAMECSSHGLDQNRVGHLEFEGGAFLNLTHDHLDYHQTMEEYYQAKKKLFLIAKKNSVICRITDIQLGLMGSSCNLVHEGRVYPLFIPMIGSYHIFNMVAAIMLVNPFVKDLELLCKRASTFPPVAGRSELIPTQKGFSVMVDYAHKPDALEKLLLSLKKAGAKKITTVFGCGGERDKEKRPKMAKIAEKHSQKVIVTTDNPRKEDPLEIIEMIRQGFDQENHRIILDRKEAIKQALMEAEEGELVLIAGRGHEKEQKLRTASIPFLDSEVAKNLLIEI